MKYIIAALVLAVLVAFFGAFVGWGVMLALGNLYHAGVIDVPVSYEDSFGIGVIMTLFGIGLSGGARA